MSIENVNRTFLKMFVFLLYTKESRKRVFSFKKKEQRTNGGKLNINSKGIDLEASSVNNYTKYK